MNINNKNYKSIYTRTMGKSERYWDGPREMSGYEITLYKNDIDNVVKDKLYIKFLYGKYGTRQLEGCITGRINNNIMINDKYYNIDKIFEYNVCCVCSIRLAKYNQKRKVIVETIQNVISDEIDFLD